MTFSPTLEDPAWLYPIDVYFYNITNNRTLSKQQIQLYVLEPDYVKQSFERNSLDVDAAERETLAFTVFEIETITPYGLINITFSNPLNEPNVDDGLTSWKDTPSQILQVEYTENYDGWRDSSLGPQQFSFEPD